MALEYGYCSPSATPLSSTTTMVQPRARPSSTATIVQSRTRSSSTSSTDTVIIHRPPSATNTPRQATLPFRPKLGSGNPDLKPNLLEVLNWDENNRVANRWCNNNNNNNNNSSSSSSNNNEINRAVELAAFRAEQSNLGRILLHEYYKSEERSPCPKDWRVVVAGKDRLGDVYLPTPPQDTAAMEGYFTEQDKALLGRLGKVLHREVEEDMATLTKKMMLEVLGGPEEEEEERVQRRNLERGIEELEMLVAGWVGERSSRRRGWEGEMVGNWESLRWFALWGWGDFPGGAAWGGY